jgi:hypothetical protein
MIALRSTSLGVIRGRAELGAGGAHAMVGPQPAQAARWSRTACGLPEANERCPAVPVLRQHHVPEALPRPLTSPTTSSPRGTGSPPPGQSRPDVDESRTPLPATAIFRHGCGPVAGVRSGALAR